MFRSSDHRAGTILLVLVLFGLLLIPLQGSTDNATAGARPVTAQDGTVPSGKVIVILKSVPGDERSVRAAAASHAVRPTQVYSHAFSGYATTVTAAEARELLNDPNVAGVVPDLPVEAASQTMPTGVRRVGADTNAAAKIDGVNDTMNVDVAVVDSGVSNIGGQLNISGGVDCTASLDPVPPTPTPTPAHLDYYGDDYGHGTHVAGTIAAIDDGDSVVGVAPGARIWSVKVLNGTGSGSTSTLLCGLDWVYANRTTIDVVNMSLTSSAGANENVADCASSPLHTAICAIYAAGIPMAVAAGNTGRNISERSCNQATATRTKTPTAKAGATNTPIPGPTAAPPTVNICFRTEVVPAVYGEVVAVGAFNDFNGLPGGLSVPPPAEPPPADSCRVNGADDDGDSGDDEVAVYSNWGSAVDILAPGSCILSLRVGGGVTYKSGTSMATPHVAGALALYKLANPSGTASNAYGSVQTAAKTQASVYGLVATNTGLSTQRVLWLGSAVPPTITSTPTPSSTPTRTPTAIPGILPYPYAGSSASTGSTTSVYVRDGKLNTSWSTLSSTTTPSSAWVRVQLQSTKPIGRIRWVFGVTGMADSYKIQISSDGTTWTTLATRSNAAVGTWQKLTVTNKSANYVRFLFANPNQDARLGGIAEIEVYAPSPTPTPTPTRTSTPTVTPTPSLTPTLSSTPTPTDTPTTIPPTDTPTPLPTDTPTETPLPTETPTEIPTETPTIGP